MREMLPPRRSPIRLVAWTVVLLLISFVGGVFVGLHPNWLPFSPPASMIGDSWANPSGDKPTEFNREADQPTTEPTTQPAVAPQPHTMPPTP
jgi:hypothetical protein